MIASHKPRIRIAQFEAKTLSWWKTRRASIDMLPEYQRRGRLWSAADKAYLIDSILNGFDIPKLYIADFTYSDSKLNTQRLPYAVIDGKQRFEAIFDFFDGKITLNEDCRLLEQPTRKISGLGYKDLVDNHADLAEAFDNFNLSVMSVVTEDSNLINELFVRLNRSKPLTGAEIRNAMTGPVPAVLRTIAKHEFFKNFIAFPVARGQDLNAAAKLLMFEYYDRPLDTKKSRLDSFTKEAAKSRKELELATRRTLGVLDELLGIFLPHDRLLSSAGSLPVYYWFIRSLTEADTTKVRQFLVRFEEARTAVRKEQPVAKAFARRIADLHSFNELSRSTNDEVSQVDRVKILERLFLKRIGVDE